MCQFWECHSHAQVVLQLINSHIWIFVNFSYNNSSVWRRFFARVSQILIAEVERNINDVWRLRKKFLKKRIFCSWKKKDSKIFFSLSQFDKNSTQLQLLLGGSSSHLDHPCMIAAKEQQSNVHKNNGIFIAHFQITRCANNTETACNDSYFNFYERYEITPGGVALNHQRVRRK